MGDAWDRVTAYFSHPIKIFYKIQQDLYGPVKVSTGILRYNKRVEPGNLFKGPNLKLNANDNNVALAA